MNRMDVFSKRHRRFLPLGESRVIYDVEVGHKKAYMSKMSKDFLVRIKQKL